jgi:hypothetical protein
MSAATQDPAVTVPDETTGYFVIGSTLPDPTVNLLKRLMHQESTVLDWTVDLRVVGSEIWIWDDRADRHVRMTEEELSRICTGWEELDRRAAAPASPAQLVSADAGFLARKLRSPRL